MAQDEEEVTPEAGKEQDQPEKQEETVQKKPETEEGKEAEPQAEEQKEDKEKDENQVRGNTKSPFMKHTPSTLLFSSEAFGFPVCFII